MLAEDEGEDLNEETLGLIRRRIAAIERAKERLSSRIATDEGILKGAKRRRMERIAARNLDTNNQRNGPFRAFRFGNGRRIANNNNDNTVSVEEEFSEDIVSSEDEEPAMTEAEAIIFAQEQEIQRQLRAIEVAEDIKRKVRVQEIDRLILEGQNRMVELQCEKDFLQQRPNPLFNYTSEEGENVSRTFNFPSQSLVEDYIEGLKSSGRLIMLNHTSLWRSESDDYEDDEMIGDDSVTASKSNKKTNTKNVNRRRRNGNSSNGGGRRGGNWLLRQTLGKGIAIGEKLGETIEAAAYHAVCSAVMSILARSISAIHGVNIMKHSDIRLHLGQAPDSSSNGEGIKTEKDAQDTMKQAIQRGSKRNKGKNKNAKNNRSKSMDVSFMQRDAVVETLISHCQISAPLLKLFPIIWQRAILGNIITLITAITSDFCAGMKFQILGHQLSLSFKPMTEKDVIRQITNRIGFNQRRAKMEEFEAAVSATAQDLSDQMKFLDRWHHRALGSGMLRAQIGNLIARIVLTLVDDVLCGATIDLWAAQAGGPRVITGLEHRVDKDEEVS